MTQPMIINALAQLGALRIQFSQLASDANIIASKMVQVEQQFMEILSNTSIVETANSASRKRSYDEMTPPSAQSGYILPSSVGPASIMTITPNKPKEEKVYPGYPKKCEWCHDFDLKTPRSKSGHERKCPCKPRSEKISPVEEKSEQEKKELISFVDSLISAKTATKKPKNQSESVLVDSYEEATDLCDDEMDDQEDEDEEEIGSLEDFVAHDDEIEFEEGSENDQSEPCERNPEKKRRLVKRSRVIEDEDSNLQ